MITSHEQCAEFYTWLKDPDYDMPNTSQDRQLVKSHNLAISLQLSSTTISSQFVTKYRLLASQYSLLGVLTYHIIKQLRPNIKLKYPGARSILSAELPEQLVAWANPNRRALPRGFLTTSVMRLRLMVPKLTWLHFNGFRSNLLVMNQSHLLFSFHKVRILELTDPGNEMSKM